MSRRGAFRDRQLPDSHRVVITDSRTGCCHERERGLDILDVVFAIGLDVGGCGIHRQRHQTWTAAVQLFWGWTDGSL
jgi:hypothetical protein